MTGYDPFSYGQIKLGSKPEGKADSPDDILFDDAGPTPQAKFGEDKSSDWELPDASTDPLLAGLPEGAAEAGTTADIIGEYGPGLPAPVPMAAPEEPAEVGVSRQRRKSERAPLRSTPVATRPLSREPRRKRFRPFGYLIPPLFFAAGGSGATWFYMVEHNVVMAGIVAATGIIGTVFTRLLFR